MLRATGHGSHKKREVQGSSPQHPRPCAQGPRETTFRLDAQPCRPRSSGTACAGAKVARICNRRTEPVTAGAQSQSLLMDRARHCWSRSPAG